MAGPLLAALPAILKGAAAVGGVGLGALGLSSWLGGEDREARRERFQPRLNELISGYESPRLDISQLPPLATPDMSGYREGLRGATEAERRGIQRLRSELGGMYNLGEDPRARQLLDFTRQDIANRRSAYEQGIRSAYEQAVGGIGAQRAAIDPEAAAAAAAEIYQRQAEGLAGGMGETAEAISTGGGADVVGVGGQTGEAADIANMIAASEAISADAARTGANYQREALDFLAAATQASGAARQGELLNMAAMAEAEAQRQFMIAENERVNREREQMRAAELSLRERELGLESDLARRMADIDLAEAEARAQAENFWMREGGLAPVIVGEQMERQLQEQLPAEIERSLISSGIESRDAFTATIGEMLADPAKAQVLANQYGIFNVDDAKDYWDNNYKTTGGQGGFRGSLSQALETSEQFGPVGYLLTPSIFAIQEAMRRFGSGE